MKKLRWIILSLIGIINVEGKNCIFKSEKEAKTAFPGSNIVSREIVDLSYYQIFKRVMSIDNQQYLISFLNGIYFPGAKEEDIKIRRIEALDKETTQLGETSHNGIMFCDIACKCIYYADHSSENEEGTRKRSRDEIEEAFDLEMQRVEQTFFTERLIEYGGNLRRRHSIPTKALGLLNFPMKQAYDDASACYAWCKIDPKTNQPERLTGEENILETNSIDLRKLARNEEIYINGKQLDIVGITWLKLFAIKQWGVLTLDKRYEIYYPEEQIDENIKSVIKNVLAKVSQEEWERIILQKEYEEDALDTAKKEGIQVGIEEGIKQNVRKIYSKGMQAEQIAAMLDLPFDEVQQILAE